MEVITAFWDVIWHALADKSVCQCLKEPTVSVLYPADGGRRFLWNIRTYLPDCIVSHPLGQQFSDLLSREPQNLHIKWCVSTYEQNNSCLWSHSLVLSVHDIWCKIFTIRSKYASNLRDFLQVKLCVHKTQNIRNVSPVCVYNTVHTTSFNCECQHVFVGELYVAILRLSHSSCNCW